MSPSVIEKLAWTFAVVRVLIGLAPFVAAGPLADMLGFPRAHNTPTTRVMARFFGTRDIGLGVLAAWAAADLAKLPFIALFQASMDGGDLVSVAIPIVRKQGINRAALTSAAFALTGGAAWIILFILVKS